MECPSWGDRCIIDFGQGGKKHVLGEVESVILFDRYCQAFEELFGGQSAGNEDETMPDCKPPPTWGRPDVPSRSGRSRR